MEAVLAARTLSPVEDARLLRRFLDLTGLTQSRCAERLGRSQPSVANRLRLLRLPEAVLDRLHESGLSERHARALLRLPDAAAQSAALEAFIEKKMSVAQAEDHVEKLLMHGSRGVLDGLHRELTELRRQGVCSQAELRETDAEYLLLLHIPKAGNFPDF